MRTEDELRSALRAGLPETDLALDDARTGVQHRVRRARYQRAGLVAALVLVVVAVAVPTLLGGGGEEVEMRPVDVPLSEIAEQCLVGPLAAVFAEGQADGRHWVAGHHRSGHFSVHVSESGSPSCGPEARGASSRLDRNWLALDEGQSQAYQEGPVVFGIVAKRISRVQVTLRTGVVHDLKPIVLPDAYSMNIFLLFPTTQDDRVGVGKVVAFEGDRKRQERDLHPYLACDDDERPEIQPPGQFTGPSQQEAAEQVQRQSFSHIPLEEQELTTDPPRAGGSMAANFYVLRKGRLVGEIGTLRSGSTFNAWVLFRCVPR